MRLIDERRLYEALELLASFGSKYPELDVAVALDGIRDDYDRMADYWGRGYRDPQLEEIYSALLRRMYRLTANVSLRYAVGHLPFLSGISRRISGVGRDWSLLVLRAALEGFVSDVAMSGLEPEHKRKERQTEIHTAHQRLMDDLFDYIWTSEQWNDGTAEQLGEILLSPTVDSNDQQLIVSAVMLGCMNMFDISKFRLLVNVYRNSADEKVRQRALVGWALALDNGRDGIFPEQRAMVDGLLADTHVCDELTELQIQMLYCMNAESDNRKIQREIMPDILKHNNLHITPGGIEEKAEDPMQDILDPEASERSMEKVEEGFRKMVDMQKQGSDIYFGGFSQMKRFPFFDSISNWFVPFYVEHPGISGVFDAFGESRFMQMMLNSGPFCNSDKYSFIMAFRQVLDRLPQNMREMLNNGEAAVPGGMPIDGQDTPAYIRRIYLQDIYRFFRLYPARSNFYNPFDYRKADGQPSGYIFFANRIFKDGPLEARFGEIGAFMLKHKMLSEAAELLDNYGGGAKDYQYYMLAGHVLLRRDETLMYNRLSDMTASQCFGHALEMRPGDIRALIGCARALFYEGKYAEAADAYGRLMAAEPEKRSHQLGYCVCLTNFMRYDEALKVLYRLDYERPDDENVNRVMARALMGDGKYEQAEKVYQRLRERGVVDSNDTLNAGYCAWFAGRNKVAADNFVAYLKSRSANASIARYREMAEKDIIGSERDFISAHGITDTEMSLMVDLVCANVIS